MRSSPRRSPRRSTRGCLRWDTLSPCGPPVGVGVIAVLVLGEGALLVGVVSGGEDSCSRGCVRDDVVEDLGGCFVTWAGGIAAGYVPCSYEDWICTILSPYAPLGAQKPH